MKSTLKKNFLSLTKGNDCLFEMIRLSKKLSAENANIYRFLFTYELNSFMESNGGNLFIVQTIL